MFGKTKDASEHDQQVGSDADGFFGDEEAAAKAATLDGLATRVQQVESQLNSQFTSMAAYAQIAQEQVELARSEASMAVDRSEKRLVELIERERNDRLAATGSGTTNPDGAIGWSSPEAEARLANLESSVAEIRTGLAECLARQKALADAITALFESPTTSSPMLPPPPTPESADGPIEELSLT